jgi:GR25 family glycosyltransferase involved in LPS biosynthesis
MTLLYANLQSPTAEAKEDFDVYVIHNHQLTERRAFIEKKIPNAKFIQIELDAPDLLKKYYRGKDQSAWNRKCLSIWSPIPQAHELRPGEIACTTSHFYAYQNFLQNSKKKFLVILEDDAVFEDDIKGKIQRCIEEIPERVDALFIGGGFPHYVAQTLGQYKNFLIKHHPATNTTVSYVLKRELVEKIMNNFTHFDMPIDFELAYLLMINNGLVFHVDPYFVQEGSKSGDYQTSIGLR